jgi:radical SAM protein with 4Fe4S-binding SPASM domain
MRLEDYNIFTIPIGHYFGKETDAFYLIYAPLTDNMLMSDADTVRRMKEAEYIENRDAEIEELLDQLKETGYTGIPAIQKPEDYQVLYVLVNYMCNLSCPYCFSAKGRSNKVLSKANLKAVLDYFIDSQRCDGKPLRITFTGGGEPTMSWDVVKYGLKYASQLAEEQKIPLKFGLISNGSLIKEEMVGILSHYLVSSRISFEIIEEIQNKQRGFYHKVCHAIDMMVKAGIKVEIRSVITPDNVNRMNEMADEMIKRFPEVDTYYFDPVADSKIFHDETLTTLFYNSYRHSFLKAKQLATQNNKQIKCAVSRSLETIVDRYCQGEFCLTPEGTISVCMEVSSPQEEGYEKHIYGRVDENKKLVIDYDKYRQLRQKDMACNNPRCETCFVKWNCGGGCMASNNQYPEAIRKIICDFTQTFSCDLLFEKLNEMQIMQSGISLYELVNNYNNVR